MAKCLISLGSNLGERAALLDAAVERLLARPEIRDWRESRRIETLPVGGPPGQSPFLNSAAVCETSLAPAELLDILQATETALGRVRAARWDARPIDLDLLLYDDVVMQSPTLALPHPRLTFRRFVLAPAAEVAPEMRHPIIGWTMHRLLEHLDAAPNVIAIKGAAAWQRQQLADAVAANISGNVVTRTSLPVRAASGINPPLTTSRVTICDFGWADLDEPEKIIVAKLLGTDAPKLTVRLTTASSSPPLSATGPVLDLPAADFDRALAEVSAAAMAMQ